MKDNFIYTQHHITILCLQQMNNKFTLTDMCVIEVLKQLLKEEDVLIQLRGSSYEERIVLFEEHTYYPIAILLADKFTWCNDYHPLMVEYWPIDLLPLDSCNVPCDKYLSLNLNRETSYNETTNEFLSFFDKWKRVNTNPISLNIMTIILSTYFMSDINSLLSATSFIDIKVLFQELKIRLSNEELNNYSTFKAKISTKIKDIENSIKLLE